ncbi:MAG: UDP-N-acetylmuramoyl-L-alanine--D-glutamate ligase [Eubacteriales bacterium]
MKATDKLREKVSGKRVAVLGIGVSNTPVIDLLLELGAVVTAHDKKETTAMGPLADELRSKGVTLRLGENYLDHIDADVIFLSPGIRYDQPGILDALSRGAVLTSEMSEFFEICPCKILAVTGSDGKTTTTTLIAKLLEAAGRKVFLGGNIGTPLLPLVDRITPDDLAVVELSSFQLHTMHRSPSVAVVTNVTPNHLNWHTDMQEYIDAKMNLLRYQTPDCLTVLNLENEITASAKGLVRGRRVFFTSKRVPEQTAGFVYEKDGTICYEDTPVLRSADIRIPGRHNVENYMAAIAATWGMVSVENIRQVATTFGGVEHRIEFVRELDRVRYYNSSIDSSPTRTIAALNAFNQKLIVLCGGYDKHIPYEPLGTPLCEHARAVILTGTTAPKIRDAIVGSPAYVQGSPELYEAKDYAEAVRIAREIAGKGDVVLMSPASASFDAFKNFEERGRFFKKKVMEL